MAARGFRRARISSLVGRILNRVPWFDYLVRASPARRGSRILVPMMGPRWDLLAAGALRGEPVVYAWDIWEPRASEWVENLHRYGVRHVMGSSTAAGNLLDRFGFKGVYIHVPEATTPEKYRSGSLLVDRSIKVLELGRRHDSWHLEILRSNLLTSKSHLYERSAGDLVFATRSDLIRGLSDSAVSVCFPRSVTHPENAGSISTFTHRYLESMVSGCLIVGHCPPDLEKLFGYNPLVEVDWDRPLSQIEEILTNLSAYQNLVDRNLRSATVLGSWDYRSKEIEAFLTTIDTRVPTVD